MRGKCAQVGVVPAARPAAIPAALLAALLAVGTAACSGSPDDDGRPVRVDPLPAGVTGLGPAVFLAEVADERRTDLRGLLAIERLGDDLAGVQPVRRHVELAHGDPTAPTVARGLAEDPRDALLSGGRVTDVELPGRSFVREATTVGELVITRNTCLIVRADGQIRRPAEGEVTCRPGQAGGIVWQDRTTGQAGGVDVTTGEPSPGLVIPGEPLGATPDGRHVFSEASERLVVADTATGTFRHTEVQAPRSREEGEFAVAARGYYFVRFADDVRRFSVLGLDGKVTELTSPVGRVAFSPDRTRAVVSETRDGASRIALADLASGDLSRPAVDDGPRYSVVASVTDRHALIAEVTTIDAYPEPVPVRMWTLDLEAGRMTAAPTTMTANSVQRLAGGSSPRRAGHVAALSFGPDGHVAALSEDARVAMAAPGLQPWVPLPGGRVLSRVEGKGDLADQLVVTGADGRAVEIATGAGERDSIRHVTATPDGDHVLVSLRRDGGRTAAGPLSRLVVARLDGAGEPVVLYRGVELVSLGLTG